MARRGKEIREKHEQGPAYSCIEVVLVSIWSARKNVTSNSILVALPPFIRDEPVTASG